MAFKIESLAEMNRIASRISERKQEMQSNGSSANASLETLKTVISGYGVEKNLAALEEAITTNVNNVNNLLELISDFITKQISGYTINEENLANRLANAQSQLENIQG